MSFSYLIALAKTRISVLKVDILVLFNEMLSDGIACLAFYHTGILLNSEFHEAVSLWHRYETRTLIVLLFFWRFYFLLLFIFILFYF